MDSIDHFYFTATNSSSHMQDPCFKMICILFREKPLIEGYHHTKYCTCAPGASWKWAFASGDADVGWYAKKV